MNDLIYAVGYASWDNWLGPFDTREEAESAVAHAKTNPHMDPNEWRITERERTVKDRQPDDDEDGGQCKQCGDILSRWTTRCWDKGDAWCCCCYYGDDPDDCTGVGAAFTPMRYWEPGEWGEEGA